MSEDKIDITVAGNVQNSQRHCPSFAREPPTTGPITPAMLQVLRDAFVSFRIVTNSWSKETRTVQKGPHIGRVPVA